MVEEVCIAPLSPLARNAEEAEEALEYPAEAPVADPMTARLLVAALERDAAPCWGAIGGR